MVVSHTTLAEKIVTIAAVPITVILLFLAAYITRRESKPGQCGIIVLYLAAMGYFIFKLVRMYDPDDPGRVAEYKPARHSLTTFAVITLLLLIVTIVVSFMCMANFGKGLKPHIQGRKTIGPVADGKVYGGDGYGNNSYAMPVHRSGTVSTRMTID